MIIRAIITTILLVALTLVSYGHQSVSPETEAQVDAYILAGGDWGDLCGDGEDPLGHANKCMACLIAQGLALPAPAETARTTLVAAPADWLIALDHGARQITHSSQTARAPPFA